MKIHNLVLLIMIIWAASLMSSLSFAADGSSGTGRFDFRKKASSKENSRWTLQDWLAQKERNQMMDLWLAMYSPSPYEFFISGTYLSYESKADTAPNTSDKHTSYSGSLGAYATVIGLEIDYENNTAESINDLAGSLRLRFAGNAVQGTHLIAYYGLRTRMLDTGASDIRLNNQFAGVDLNLYLTRYFGLQGAYEYYFPVKEATLGDVSGQRSEAGLFIDFGAFRVFGNWFSEKQKATLPATSVTDRTGIQSGFKFFF